MISDSKLTQDLYFEVMDEFMKAMSKVDTCVQFSMIAQYMGLVMCSIDRPLVEETMNTFATRTIDYYEMAREARGLSTKPN